MAGPMASNAPETLSESPPLPAKRSLFKKSAWAKPTEAEEAIDMFSRAKELFPAVAADSEKRRKEKKKKRNSHEAKLEQEVNDETKRLRASIDVEPDARTVLDPRSSSVSGPSTSPTTKVKGSPLGVRRRSSSTKVDRTCYTAISIPNVISLSDSSDEETPPRQKKSEECEPIKPHPASPQPPRVEELSDDDDKFAEYIKKARENQNRIPFSRIAQPSNNTADSPAADKSMPRPTTTFNARPADPVVSLLITSQIAGTVPLQFKRKVSQRLKDVRLAWCDRQFVDGGPLLAEMKQSIILTWRGTRLFDVSTCKSMGLQIDASGTPSSGGGDGFNDGRIHLEAWTEETFRNFQTQRQLDRQRRALKPYDLPDEEEEPETPASKESKGMRILIKARGFEDFKVLVRPQTPISKIIHAFQSFHDLPPEKHIDLRFDGDKLEPDSLVGEADLEEMSSIDAYVH